MPASSIVAKLRWLFILVSVNLLLAACSGSLGPISEDPEQSPGEGDDNNPSLPATPTVNDLNILTSQEANITGSCEKNANRSNQTDIIQVTIATNTQTAPCVGSGLGTWSVSYPANTFTKGQYTITAIAQNNDGSESNPGFGNITVVEDDGDIILPGDGLDPVKPTFDIDPVEYLETQSVVISGGCTRNDGAENETNFLSIAIENNGQTVTKTTACKSDAAGDTWRVDMGQFTADVYIIRATALNNSDRRSEVATANLYVESAIISMLVDLEKTEIESGETSLITVTFQDQLGNILSGAVSDLRFASSCIQKNNANMLDQNGEEVDSFSSATGSVLAVYQSDGCNGDDEINITGIFNGALVTLETPVIISTKPDKVAQIRWVSSTPDSIVTQGSNGEQIAEIVFELVGIRGAKVPNQQVDFEIKTVSEEQTSDLTLLNDTAESDNQGQVRVRIRSGFKPINVTISASHTDPDSGEVIEGQSFDLSVTSGLTSYGNFSLDLRRFSPLSFDRSSATVDKLEVIATVNDRFGDSVSDGTRVTFKVESTTLSSDEGAIGSFFDETGEIKDAFCKTVDGVCSIFWAPNKNNVLDGWVTIMAVAKGQENFVDANSNNIFDDGDSFFDTAEPYLDQRAYWRQDLSQPGGELIQHADYVEGEYYLVDTNDDGIRNLSNGKFDGVNCQHSTDCSGKGYIDVAAQIVFNQASADNIGICQTFDIQNVAVVGANQQISFNNLSFCDQYTGEALPTGTTFNIVVSDGASVVESGFETMFGQDKFIKTFGATIEAGEEIKRVSLSAEVTVPKADTANDSDITSTFSIGSIDIIFPIFSNNFPERPSLNIENVVKKGEQFTATGSCSETSSYLDITTDELVDVPSAALDFYVDANKDSENICSAGNFSQPFRLTHPGLRTVSMVAKSTPNSALPESSRVYISEPQVQRVYVTNSPSSLLNIELNGNAWSSSAVQADAAGAIHLSGSCENQDTTHALVRFNAINDVNKVDANQLFEPRLGQPTITTTGFFKTIEAESYAAAYCNQGQWMLSLTGFGANDAVNNVEIFSLNEKERIHISTWYGNNTLDFSMTPVLP